MARILYADDDELLRKSTRRIAGVLGHEIVVVGNGAQAWELLQHNERFDLIISDFEMPQLNGFSLLKKVRSHAQLRTISCVLISGRDNPYVAQWCAEFGIRFYEKGSRSMMEIISEALDPPSPYDGDRTA